MEKIKEFYVGIGYYKAMAQMLSFVAGDQQKSISDYILKFELKEKEFRKHIDILDYSDIANDFHNWDEAAQEMIVEVYKLTKGDSILMC